MWFLLNDNDSKNKENVYGISFMFAWKEVQNDRAMGGLVLFRLNPLFHFLFKIGHFVHTFYFFSTSIFHWKWLIAILDSEYRLIIYKEAEHFIQFSFKKVLNFRKKLLRFWVTEAIKLKLLPKSYFQGENMETISVQAKIF